VTSRGRGSSRVGNVLGVWSIPPATALVSMRWGKIVPRAIFGPARHVSIPIAERSNLVDLAPQTSEFDFVADSSEGEAFAVEARLHWQVVDPVASFASVYDLPSAMKAVTVSSTVGLAKELRSGELADPDARLAAAVASNVSQTVSGWGVKVIDLEVPRIRQIRS
jgi:hypothetical protein